MRQRQLLTIVICALILAACGNPAPATQAVIQQNGVSPTDTPAAPTEIVPTQGPREYSDGTQEVVLPETGTIVPPATEDPSAGKLYSSVALDRIGGIEGKPLDILLLSDGTLTRDGVKSVVPAEQVKQISDTLDQLGFFGLQGVFQGVGTSPDVYTYYITAERDGASRTITAQDGFMPPAFTELVRTLSQLGATN
ncbi:MAG: hypothetical protein GC179_23915 [Anaerolineaceae bacterium]|nr:hypothetical protein [Anaerolineaceae bacterium]